MLFDSIADSYLIPLDEQGNAAYKAMRNAELTWITKTKFRYSEIGGRKYIVIATNTKLPPIADLLRTREDFSEYIQATREAFEKAGISIKETIGVRSTSMPAWLLPDNQKITIEESVSKSLLEPATKITIRRKPAWRSQYLNREKTTAMIDDKIRKLRISIEIYEKNQNKKRAEEVGLKLERWLADKDLIEGLFEQHGTELTARLRSGNATHIDIKTKSHRWTTTIANVGLVYGNARTEIEERNTMRDRVTALEPVGAVGNFVFFKTRGE